MTTPYEPLLHMGSLFRWHACAADTGGAYALAEVELHAGSEPPPHTHTHEDESFFVLVGELELVVDGRTLRAGPRTLAFLPRGKKHGFRVLSERVRMLLLITPGGLEEAFRATSEPAVRDELPPPPDGPPPLAIIEQVLAAQAARGVHFDLEVGR